MRILDLWSWYDHGLDGHHKSYLDVVGNSYTRNDISLRIHTYDTFVETNFMISQSGYKYIYKRAIGKALRHWWLAYKYARLWKTRVHRSKQMCVNTCDLCLCPIDKPIYLVEGSNVTYQLSCSDVKSIIVHSLNEIANERRFKVVNPYTLRVLKTCEIWHLYLSLRMFDEKIPWIFDELVRVNLDWVCVECKFRSYFNWTYRESKVNALSDTEYTKKWKHLFEYVSDRFFPWDDDESIVHVDSVPRHVLKRESTLLNMFYSYGLVDNIPKDIYLRMLALFLGLWSEYPKFVSFTYHRRRPERNFVYLGTLRADY